MATDARRSAANPASAAAPVLSPRLIVGGGLLLVAIVYLVITSLQTSAVYYITVGELLAGGSGAAGQTFRVSGEVVDGSIERDRQHLRFSLTDGSASIPVAHTGVVPDLFGYRAEGAYQDVVVEGRYTAGGVFEARNIIVRHGPTFESAEGGDVR
jgi:cytochrome c-type biogenesis protein CcmE